jgi:hypothetical protein
MWRARQNVEEARRLRELTREAIESSRQMRKSAKRTAGL